MVTDVRDEPVDVAYERFKELTEEDPDLIVTYGRSGAYLKKQEGGRFSAYNRTLMGAHPEKRGMNLEPPYYCLTVRDAAYEDEAFDVAEAIEDVVDVEVYVFHREK